DSGVRTGHFFTPPPVAAPSPVQSTPALTPSNACADTSRRPCRVSSSLHGASYDPTDGLDLCPTSEAQRRCLGAVSGAIDPQRSLGSQICCDAQRGISYHCVVGCQSSD